MSWTNKHSSNNYRKGQWLHSNNDGRRKRIEMLSAIEGDKIKAEKLQEEEIAKMKLMMNPFDGKYQGDRPDIVARMKRISSSNKE